MTFLIAKSIEEALDAMASGARPIAGGTDLVVGARVGSHELPPSLVAIDRIPELNEIGSTERLDGVFLQIGAAVSHSRLMSDPAITSDYGGLADASALVGSPATRNVGTIGGNIMNASPAMDTGAPLLALGGLAVLASTDGCSTRTRTVPLAELWLGPGRTSAETNELCIAVLLPAIKSNCASAYVRLEYRRSMEIAVVGAGAAIELDAAGKVLDLSVALSAVGPTIMNVAGLAETANGRPVDEQLLGDVAKAASVHASPISDLRASAEYRRHTVGVMAKRVVAAAAARASGDAIAIPTNRSTGIGANQ